MNVFELTGNLIKLDEETTESSIAYLPSTLGAVKSAVYSLAKMKSDWDISFNEDNKSRNVSFEDALKVSVPLQYWDSFSKTFGVNKAGKMSLKHLLKEAIEADMTQLRQELKPTLHDFYNGPLFTGLDRQVNLWRSIFGITEVYETKTAVSFDEKEKDIQFLTTKLLKVYGDDKGGLELLLAAIRDKKVLSSFQIFNKFDFLYGIKTLSLFRKVNIIYEVMIDTNYQISQSIMLDPKYPDIIYAIEDMKEPSVKIVKNVIYPIGAGFEKRFLKLLKNEIKENVD